MNPGTPASQAAAPLSRWHSRPPLSVPSRVEKPLAFEDGPLVWIDCEMTGLNYKKDHILEIAVIITNGNLDIVDEGVSYIIKTDKEILDNMDPWCVKQHGASGLTAACLASPHDLKSVSSAVLSYVKEWIPRHRVAILAGNSIHADRAFLAEYMPELIEHLHYRLVDVSTIKELCRRWFPQVTQKRATGDIESKHRALDDIKGSIAELRFYRDTVFIDPKTMLGRSEEQS